ncbi:hypothetical protein V2I01_05895 [Micromonospora sp. BRA006-A]|nr:hypothetical protein [Micromonospora sp. BRA006-A]
MRAGVPVRAWPPSDPPPSSAPPPRWPGSGTPGCCTGRADVRRRDPDLGYAGTADRCAAARPAGPVAGHDPPVQGVPTRVPGRTCWAWRYGCTALRSRRWTCCGVPAAPRRCCGTCCPGGASHRDVHVDHAVPAGGRRLFLAVLADPESPDLGRGLAGAGAAVAADEPRLVLAVASAVGRWRPFGEVRLDDERGAAEDAALAFDPIGNVPPGLRLAGPLARLRDDSYRGSRRARGAGLSRAARRGDGLLGGAVLQHRVGGGVLVRLADVGLGEDRVGLRLGVVAARRLLRQQMRSGLDPFLVTRVVARGHADHLPAFRTSERARASAARRVRWPTTRSYRWFRQPAGGAGDSTMS